MTTTKRQTLLDLAARVEGLDVPSREVDARIAHAIAWRWDGWTDGDVEIERRDLEYVIDRVGNSHNTIWRYLPAYTASLDAAMRLVPRGWQVEQVGEWYDDALRIKGPWLAILAKPMRPMADGGSGGCADPFARCQHAATAALALSASALRARAMMEPQDEN